jgi:hypothetical protein
MQINNRIPLSLNLAFRLAVTLAAGCADVSYDDPSGSGDEFGHLPPAELTGLEATLVPRSTRCDPRFAYGLLAEIGTDMEFPGEDIEQLQSSCHSQPAVDIYIVDGSLILDFGNVAKPGVFPDAEFEGFEVFIKRNCGDPAILEVAVDHEVSNMDIPDDNVRTLFDRVEVNLARMAYDPASFLKIDLRVVAIKCGNAP